MMGENAGEDEAMKLDRVMPDKLEKHACSPSIVHLVYSKRELTYERHIIDLRDKLAECRITYYEKIEQFENHEEIGTYFLKYVMDYFKNLTAKNM